MTKVLYLKFQVQDQLYKFVTLPDGLSSAPQFFTKLMKPVHSTLQTRVMLLAAILMTVFCFAIHLLNVRQMSTTHMPFLMT